MYSAAAVVHDVWIRLWTNRVYPIRSCHLKTRKPMIKETKQNKMKIYKTKDQKDKVFEVNHPRKIYFGNNDGYRDAKQNAGTLLQTLQHKEYLFNVNGRLKFVRSLCPRFAYITLSLWLALRQSTGRNAKKKAV